MKLLASDARKNSQDISYSEPYWSGCVINHIYADINYVSGTNKNMSIVYPLENIWNEVFGIFKLECFNRTHNILTEDLEKLIETLKSDGYKVSFSKTHLKLKISW